MSVKRFSVATVALLACGLLVSLDQAALAQARPIATIEGAWSGDFGAGEWTFKFLRANNAWSGSYTYPQYKGWNPVTNLSASAESARFSIKARDSIDFSVKLDNGGQKLVGKVRFGHGITPTSAPVIVPVSLKRVGR